MSAFIHNVNNNDFNKKSFNNHTKRLSLLIFGHLGVARVAC